MLPSPWKEISYANPILYMVNTFRYGLLDVTDISLGWAYAVMLGFVVVLGAICLNLAAPRAVFALVAASACAIQ